MNEKSIVNRMSTARCAGALTWWNISNFKFDNQDGFCSNGARFKMSLYDLNWQRYKICTIRINLSIKVYIKGLVDAIGKQFIIKAKRMFCDINNWRSDDLPFDSFLYSLLAIKYSILKKASTDCPCTRISFIYLFRHLLSQKGFVVLTFSHIQQTCIGGRKKSILPKGEIIF